MPARISSTGMSSAQAADGGQHVLDLEGHAAAVGQRDRGHVGQAFLARALRQHDGAVAHEHGAAILLQVGGDGGQGRGRCRKITAPSDSSAISTTRGSRAFSTV